MVFCLGICLVGVFFRFFIGDLVLLVDWMVWLFEFIVLCVW